MENLKDLITKKYPDEYKNEQALEEIITKINKMDKDIYDALLKFLETGEHQEISSGSYSLSELMRSHSMNALGAYLTLDWLRKDPENAEKSLNKGHDNVATN